MSHSTKYYVKLALAIALVIPAGILAGALGLGIFQLSATFVPSVAVFWFLWPDVLDTSELDRHERRPIRVFGAIVLVALIFVGWAVDSLRGI